MVPEEEYVGTEFTKAGYNCLGMFNSVGLMHVPIRPWMYYFSVRVGGLFATLWSQADCNPNPGHPTCKHVLPGLEMRMSQQELSPGLEKLVTVHARPAEKSNFGFVFSLVLGSFLLLFACLFVLTKDEKRYRSRLEGRSQLMTTTNTCVRA